jgi:hypothetical protein
MPYAPIHSVLTVQPGNLGMQPGRRVSQLMNIAFDMAAWVRIAAETFYPSVIDLLSGNSWKFMQRRHAGSAWPDFEGMALRDEECGHHYCHSFYARPA